MLSSCNVLHAQAFASCFGVGIMVLALTEALRNLTIALREFRASEQWEIVGPEGARAFEEATFELAAVASLIDRPRVSAATTPSSTPTSVAGLGSTTPAPEVSAGEWRHYVVLSNPGSGKVGYIAGPSSTTWGLVESTLRGGRLSEAALAFVGSKIAARHWQHGRWPSPGVQCPSSLDTECPGSCGCRVGISFGSC